MNVRNVAVKIKFGLYCFSSIVVEFWKRVRTFQVPEYG